MIAQLGIAFFGVLAVWLVQEDRIEARRWALAEILSIQARCNAARPGGLPEFNLIDQDELALIRVLQDANTWPDGWEGDEPRADAWMEVKVYANGAEQPALFSAAEI